MNPDRPATLTVTATKPNTPSAFTGYAALLLYLTDKCAPATQRERPDTLHVGQWTPECGPMLYGDVFTARQLFNRAGITLTPEQIQRVITLQVRYARLVDAARGIDPQWKDAPAPVAHEDGTIAHYQFNRYGQRRPAPAA